jgi:hypothetical protein
LVLAVFNGEEVIAKTLPETIIADTAVISGDIDVTKIIDSDCFGSVIRIMAITIIVPGLEVIVNIEP